jgi:hypothetical protein
MRSPQDFKVVGHQFHKSLILAVFLAFSVIFDNALYGPDKPKDLGGLSVAERVAMGASDEPR